MSNIRSGTCPKCQGTKIGHVPILVDWDRGAHRRRLGKGTVGRMTAYGEIEAYVCTQCGFFEEYVKTPGAVPWTSIDGFKWVDSS